MIKRFLLTLTSLSSLQASNWGIFTGADYLYMQPHLRLTSYTHLDVNLNDGDFSARTHETPFDWNSGVRIVLGAHLPCRWTLLGEWTNLYSSAKKRTFDEVDTTIGIGTDSFPALGLFQVPIPTRNSSVDFKAILNFNEAQFLLAKALDVGSTFCLIPFTGIKCLWIHSRVRDDFIGLTGPESNLFELTSLYHAHTSYTGVGITAGIKTDWSFATWFSLFAKCSTSLLLSRTHLHQREDSNNPSLNGFFNFEDRFEELDYTLDGAIGFQSCFSYNNTLLVRAKIGWEGHYISHQNRYAVFNPIGFASKPLTIQGLVVGLGVEL